ncbi:unnamed protein product [Schistocephalus solidus]|uniref:Zinc finger protein n=1 Tax=Schistocephalus solidus TaxID=70667 RepID=A0A183S9A0_SCHSO|nr:unnamed protein product [Schistocephalus solidus]
MTAITTTTTNNNNNNNNNNIVIINNNNINNNNNNNTSSSSGCMCGLNNVLLLTSSAEPTLSMPRVKGRPKHCNPLDEAADFRAETVRPRDNAATPIERTVTTILKYEKARTPPLNRADERESESPSSGALLKSTSSPPVPTPPSSPLPQPLLVPSSAANPAPSPQPPKSANRSKRKREADDTPKDSSGINKKQVNIKPKKVEQSAAGEPQPMRTAEKGKLLRPLRPLPQPVTKFVLPALTPRATKSDRDKVLTTCSVCTKVLRRGSLREHMDRHENSGKFECLTCGKNFSRASTLEKHVRAHTGERPYKCCLCPKAYRQKVHLAEHMRSHTGERPFVCRLCGFSVTSKSLLNRHLRTHGVLTSANEVPDMWLRTDAPMEQVLAAAAEVGRSLAGVTPPESQQAGAADECKLHTLRVTALNGTATLAALARKHLCDVCPAGFPTLQALRSHRLTTHGLATSYVCPTCGASLPSTKSLKVHCRTDHPQVSLQILCHLLITQSSVSNNFGTLHL